MDKKLSNLKDKLYWKWFFGATIFTGMILMVLQIDIYRSTIIDSAIPLSIVLGIGVITYSLLHRKYKEVYNVRGFFYPFMQSLLSFGFIACYVFMAGNFYLADRDSNQFTFPIKEKSSMPGTSNKSKRTPLVRFDYFGKEKELVFDYSSTVKVKESDFVTLTIKKGAFGFMVVESYDVK
ncbi:hypothetical protein ABID22_003437 [Pontibacter aydingkolensis]|uniref:Uncharacterized protein n=1 Tax=Pontibacter aydingkolensis TaxID=1911536 RepID=A0ABS7CY82_9BACT|nr:hypothetical protein [Pontibacter aydingkolensis]MBW7468782.1 hypothetical protein [Pontibacter aydingkolensis]